jgi:hypothetical protein
MNLRAMVGAEAKKLSPQKQKESQIKCWDSNLRALADSQNESESYLLVSRN